MILSGDYLISGVLVLIVGILVSVTIGFFMGLKSARPDEPIIKPKPFDPGPTDEDEQDIWANALTEPDKEERGIPTT